jgi:hypothetical protein
MRKLYVLGAALTLAFPVASRAQLELGLRVGWAGAMGDAWDTQATPVTPSQTVKMSDWISAQVPIQLDVGYRVTPQIAVGAYASYGFGDTGGDYVDSCRMGGFDCSAAVVRTGLEASYAFTSVSATLVPWAGVGAGYEWAESVAKRAGSQNQRTSVEGWEFLNLQLGADYRFHPSFAAGPYVMYSVGEYSGGSSGGAAFSSGATDRIHQWLGFGVRASWGL